MNNASTMSFKIADERSGLESYEAKVDGEWILMQFDGKKGRLFHKFDGTVKRGEHELILKVKDAVGNEAVFKRNFRR